MDWAAPETLKGTFVPASDVYSYAILTFEVLSLQLPFSGLSGAEKLKIVALQDSCSQFEFDPDLCVK